MFNKVEEYVEIELDSIGQLTSTLQRRVQVHPIVTEKRMGVLGNG